MRNITKMKVGSQVDLTAVDLSSCTSLQPTALKATMTTGSLKLEALAASPNATLVAVCFDGSVIIRPVQIW